MSQVPAAVLRIGEQATNCELGSARSLLSHTGHLLAPAVLPLPLTVALNARGSLLILAVCFAILLVPRPVPAAVAAIALASEAGKAHPEDPTARAADHLEQRGPQLRVRHPPPEAGLDTGRTAREDYSVTP